MDNVAALEIALSEEQVKYLEDVLPFVRGFPHDMIVSLCRSRVVSTANGFVDRVMGRAMASCMRWVDTSIAGRVRTLLGLQQSRLEVPIM